MFTVDESLIYDQCIQHASVLLKQIVSFQKDIKFVEAILTFERI